MNRLLVATDFSVRSDRALRRATLLARRLSAPLTLVNVVDAERPTSMIESDRNAATQLLEELARTLRTVDGIAADWLVRVDDKHAGILAAAEEIAADLIVVGPHRSRLADMFIGSTAQRVVQRSTRPVLVAVEMPSRDYQSTLLALDFDEASSLAGHRALAMGIFDSTRVIVMHAFEAPAEHLMKRSFVPAQSIEEYVEAQGKEAAGKLRGLADELNLRPSAEVLAPVTGSPAHTILQSAQDHGADLIVMGANQRKGIARALIGSVTADAIRDAHRDLLIIPVDAPE